MGIKDKFGLLSATILSAGLGLAMPAYAQDQTEEQAQSQEDTIVVTGSRIRRDEFTSSSPIQVITPEAATLEGLVDTAEILQQSSVAGGSVQVNNQFGGFVVDGGTGVQTISLRGLGAQRSLVLLNGRRPGPAGVRGAVGAFDLNVIPSSVLQRAEILKDGASSIYGSDAVAGVVNLITLDRVDEPTINFELNQPFEEGGESYAIDGAFGLNFNRGNIVIAGEYQVREALEIGDRDYLSCTRDFVFDPATGEQIDREDRSIQAGTSLAGCSGFNIQANLLFDAVFGDLYIPAPDGVTIGPILGYRPRANGPDFFEDPRNDARYLTTEAIGRQERGSLFVTSNFDLDMLGGVEWRNEFLFTRREATANGWRQFFPLIGGASAALFVDPSLGYANDPGFDGPFILSQPVTIWPASDRAEVEYTSISTQFDGNFGNSWSWTAIGTYSRSDGTYGGNSIIASRSGDVQFDADAPIYDPFSPEFLSGNYGADVFNALTHFSEGETVYEQKVFTAYATGDLFQLPAGPLGAAFGVEYRNYSINDTPDPLAQAGDLWQESSAGVTAGEDTVREVFLEVDVPIVRGVTLFEDLTVNGSIRAFEYDTSGSDSVWSAGLNWQVTPTFRIRATTGTSFRAPGLFELFLANQTGFLNQLGLDPCIQWGDSSNANLRANCAAEGIPADYLGGSEGALIITGGGAGVLRPETSEASTIGLIYTPTFIDLNIAVDYFEIEINDQISQLGAGTILGGCYGANNFPNAFCDLFDRRASTDPLNPFAIIEVRDSYINVNQQATEGIDLTVRYDHEFDFGTLLVEGQGTWTFTDVVQLFDPSLESGFDTSDFNGTIGDPDFVANARVAFERGDWTFSWFTNFISRTSQAAFADEDITYFGRPGRQIVRTDPVLYHDASVRWRGDTFTAVVGVANLADEEPPQLSAAATAVRGNTPIFGSQYDLRGRTAFMRFTKTF